MLDLLFNTENFITRNNCGNWNEHFIFIDMYSALASFFAFMTLPLVILWLDVAWKRTIHSKLVRRSFALFIFACGLTRLEVILAFFWPAYHFFALIHALTAALAWATIGSLIFVNHHHDSSPSSTAG